MHSYKLTVAYEGTQYYGWQWQVNQISVDRVIRESFLRAFSQDSMYLVGSSRTDAGVHAHGQVIRIGTEIDINSEKLKSVLNRTLPPTIVIRDCEKISPLSRFHPQHNIKNKVYIYRFFLKRPLPIVQNYGFFIEQNIDTHKLGEALSLFVGTHDFEGFSKELSDKNTTRTIESIALAPCEVTGGYKITIVGKSFLRHMIRRIVGASIEIAKKKNRSLSELKKLLLNPRLQNKNLPTAPAKGLCLESITYTENENEGK